MDPPFFESSGPWVGVACWLVCWISGMSSDATRRCHESALARWRTPESPTRQPAHQVDLPHDSPSYRRAKAGLLAGRRTRKCLVSAVDGAADSCRCAYWHLTRSAKATPMRGARACCRPLQSSVSFRVQQRKRALHGAAVGLQSSRPVAGVLKIRVAKSCFSGGRGCWLLDSFQPRSDVELEPLVTSRRMAVGRHL